MGEKTSGGSSGGMSVDVILDNLARGDTGPEYAAQWASYYRSQVGIYKLTKRPGLLGIHLL